MWDETGFSGSTYEDDPGVKNVPEGVATVGEKAVRRD